MTEIGIGINWKTRRREAVKIGEKYKTGSEKLKKKLKIKI